MSLLLLLLLLLMIAVVWHLEHCVAIVNSMLSAVCIVRYIGKSSLFIGGSVHGDGDSIQQRWCRERFVNYHSSGRHSQSVLYEFLLTLLTGSHQHANNA